VTWLGAILVVLFAWVGVALVAVTLPGIWFAVLVAAAVDLLVADVLTTWVLLTAVGLALLAEIIEFASSAAGARRAGGSRKGGWGALAGTVIGLFVGQALIPIPIVGAIIGGIAGAGVGAVVAERGLAERTWRDSLRSGRGAATGRAVSMVLKTAMGVVVASLLTIDAVATLV
jgi:uncharacterized protein YqgC (DUF456 family)